MVSALTGPARRVGLGMTDEELLPTSDAEGRELTGMAARNVAGIQLLLSKLESQLQPRKSAERGLRMRRPGEKKNKKETN